MIRDERHGSLTSSDRQAASRPQLDTERAILSIGIDLGTSRSSVAASNGVREVLTSVVGWPRDTVSSKLHGGRDVVFGDEALERRLSLDLVYPLDGGNLAYTDLDGEEQDRYRKAAQVFLEELVMRCKPRRDQLIYAVIGAPAEANRTNKRALLEIARAAGIDAAMVVSEPFSVAYGIDALDEAIMIDIGAGTIDLCRLRGTLPELEDQITLFEAGNFVDRELAKRIEASHPEVQFSLNMVKKAKERFSGVMDSAKRALVTFPVSGVPTQIDVTNELREAVELLVPPILEAIQKLVSSFDPEFQDRIRQRVFVSGGGSQIFGLDAALEEGMTRIGGGRVTLVEEPVYAGANGALKLAREMPDNFWEQLQKGPSAD